MFIFSWKLLRETSPYHIYIKCDDKKAKLVHNIACSLKNTPYLRCEMGKYFILTCSIVISLFSEKNLTILIWFIMTFMVNVYRCSP